MVGAFVGGLVARLVVRFVAQLVCCGCFVGANLLGQQLPRAGLVGQAVCSSLFVVGWFVGWLACWLLS